MDKNDRREIWRKILIGRGLTAEPARDWQNEILDMLEDSYRQGWSDCYDATRGESASERSYKE